MCVCELYRRHRSNPRSWPRRAATRAGAIAGSPTARERHGGAGKRQGPRCEKPRSAGGAGRARMPSEQVPGESTRREVGARGAVSPAPPVEGDTRGAPTSSAISAMTESANVRRDAARASDSARNVSDAAHATVAIDEGRNACWQQIKTTLRKRDASAPACVEPLRVRRGARGALLCVLAGSVSNASGAAQGMSPSQRATSRAGGSTCSPRMRAAQEGRDGAGASGLVHVTLKGRRR